MDFRQSGSGNVQDSTSTTADSENPVPHGPKPSTRWECPARYKTNNKDQDGRPLCKYCECWNPAPFPNGNLPIEPATPTTGSLPDSNILPSQSDGRKMPHTIQSSSADQSACYSNYYLPPMPVSLSNQTIVSNLNCPSLALLLVKLKCL